LLCRVEIFHAASAVQEFHCELAQLGHCGGELGLSQVPPPGVALRRAREPGEEDTVSFRAVIVHAF
jgi:hypothetical protein